MIVTDPSATQTGSFRVTGILARRASFDVALALVERPKGPKGAGICLAQAEGLGNLRMYVLRAEGPTVC